MLPPMMPLVDDALWLGLFAGLALLAWRTAGRFDLRLSTLGLRRPFARDIVDAPAPSSWVAPATRASGNTAFDEWRDGEIARIEAQREALETRLRAFEAFVDKLKRAKDRATFERFQSEHDERNSMESPDAS